MESLAGELRHYLSDMNQVHVDVYPGDWYRDNGCKCFRLVNDGSIVGVFSITAEGELVSLIVSHLFRGKGFGKKMVKYAIEQGARFLFAFEDLVPFYAQFQFSLTHLVKWDAELAPEKWDFFSYPNGMDHVFMSLDSTPYPWPQKMGRVYTNYNLARSVVSRKNPKYKGIATAFTLKDGSTIHVYDNRSNGEGIETIVYNGHGGKVRTFKSRGEYIKFYNL